MPSFLPAATHVLEYAENDAIPSGFGSWTTTSMMDGGLSLLQGDRPPVKITFTVGKLPIGGSAIAGRRGPASYFPIARKELRVLFLNR